jgi:(1->4)-alpha-D-glucan 1-alpha-D-glucosylmutase
MAKGHEDTGLYRFFPLSARNEVGGHPDRPPESMSETHARFQALAECWPHTLLASSTHDTKRSEDVRARIAALSEFPDEWRDRLAHWQLLNTNKRATRDAIAIPGGNVEYLIYQTMIGAWPFEPSEIDSFHQRLNAYIIKAVREAKEYSSWVEPDTVYEDALLGFIDALFDRSDASEFLSDFAAFQQRIARIGALNSLSQTLIKLTAPGIPDIYRGSELWDLSLVDPDNRRPVDYSSRTQALARLENPGSQIEQLHDLTTNWQDGRVKLFLTQRGLHLRRRLPNLFASGHYAPVQVSGTRSEHAFSYVRTLQDAALMVVAPRLCSTVIDDGKNLTAAQAWGDTTLAFPSDWNGPAIDLFSGESIPNTNVQGSRSVGFADVLRNFPVGLIGNELASEALQST